MPINQCGFRGGTVSLAQCTVHLNECCRWLRNAKSALALWGYVPTTQAQGFGGPPRFGMAAIGASCPLALVPATCHRVDGYAQQTSLSAVRRCVGDIGNANGNLTCNYARGPAPPQPYYGGAPGYGQQWEGRRSYSYCPDSIGLECENDYPQRLNPGSQLPHFTEPDALATTAQHA
jgi:hypothetical protein